MGIVAFCPNGHRFKVKDELAGRTGVCPTCSARFRIPRKDAATPAPPRPTALNGPPTARVVSLDPRVAAALPVAVALDDADTVDALEPAVDVADAGPDFAPVEDVAAVVEVADDEAAVDEPTDDQAHDALPVHAALDEQSGLAWCVAVRGGAPSAPLDADAMRTWLDSGAASTDHVVWRQDWPEWRPLQDVFPEALPPARPGWP